MALSFTQYLGTGSTTNFGVPFQFLSRDHVEVRVNGTPVAFSWLSDSMVTVSPAPANGAVVEVRRNTPKTHILVDFVDGSTLTEGDLDTAALQAFFLAQESFDLAGGTLGIASDGSYSANNRRITNVGLPTQPTDAVTKQWAEDTTNTNVGIGITARDASIAARDVSVAARDASIAARDASISAKDTSVAARNTALEHRNAAAASAEAADTSEFNAGTMANNAANSASEAQGYRNEAEGFKNAAAASAAQAALFDPSSYYTKTYTDENFAAKTHNHHGLYVRHDVNTQGLTDAQKANAKTNLGITDPDLSSRLARSNPASMGQYSGQTSYAWKVPLAFKQGDAIVWRSNPSDTSTSVSAWSLGVVGDGFYLAHGGNDALTHNPNAPLTYAFMIHRNGGAAYGEIQGHRIVHTGNFTSYFTMRRVAYGQAGAYGPNTWWGWQAHAGISGGFMTSVHFDSAYNFYGYWYTLQWYWNGTYYTIGG